MAIRQSPKPRKSDDVSEPNAPERLQYRLTEIAQSLAAGLDPEVPHPRTSGAPVVFAFGSVVFSAVRVKLYAGVSVEPLPSPAHAAPV